MPFDKVLKDWCDIFSNTGNTGNASNTDLYIGLAPYKSGKEDKWAGDGKQEWIESNNICSRQITDLRKEKACQGFMLFNYSPIYSDSANDCAKAELSSIESLLENDTQISVMDAFFAMLKAIFNIFD